MRERSRRCYVVVVSAVLFHLFAVFPPSLQTKVDKSGFASVLYDASKEQKWTVVSEELEFSAEPRLMAVANFTNAQLETGWMYLEVQSRPDADDDLQARAAGIAEGYLTRTYIIEQYKEFYANDICTSSPRTCHWLRNRFRRNSEVVMRKVRENRNADPYWHQVGLFYEQMDGVSQGVKMKKMALDAVDFDFDDELGVLLLTFIADFWDMKDQFELLQNSSAQSPEKKDRPSCSVIIKHLPDKEDIFIGHNTWHEYRAMAYRLLKNYRLPYKTVEGGSEIVPGHTISMSSYAGVVMSLDDFYLTSAGLATTETTLFVYDKELLRNLDPDTSVYEPVRVMVANRLSTNGKKWTDIFSLHNSGTYNNQWMVLDYKVFNESPRKLKDGVFTVLEQLPGKIIVEDQTKTLRSKSFWSSYNRAFYPEIFRMCGAEEKVAQYGDWFTHRKTPRAKIFDRDHNKVVDLPSLNSLLRYNDFKNDPFAVVEGCTPRRTPAGALANRLDLAGKGAKCTFGGDDWMVGHWAYGCLDAKTASKDSMERLEFQAVAGPPHGGQGKLQPFQWSTTDVDGIPKFKPIDKFDFSPINHTWTMNGAQRSIQVASLCRVMLVLSACFAVFLQM